MPPLAAAAPRCRCRAQALPRQQRLQLVIFGEPMLNPLPGPVKSLPRVDSTCVNKQPQLLPHSATAEVTAGVPIVHVNV